MTNAEMRFADTFHIDGSAVPGPKLTFTVHDQWTLAEDYCYSDPELSLHLCVPAGFSFDLASIPRPLWNIIAPFELSITGPLLHDWIYRHGGVLPAGSVTPEHVFTRAEADALLDRVMREEGVRAWRRKLAYAAVRMFGGRSWRDAE